MQPFVMPRSDDPTYCMTCRKKTMTPLEDHGNQADYQCGACNKIQRKMKYSRKQVKKQ